MADIFLSYSRADRPTAQIIAEALEAEGFSVWWDKVLRAGETYDEVTERMLRDSDVVVVLWSQTSVKSKWVRAEATLGQRSSELVPAMIEDAERPIMFELTQTADLIGWAGDRNEARWSGFVADIKRSLETHQSEAAAEAAAPAAPAASSGDATIETVFWTSIKDGDDPADFEAYLKRYPQGHYSDLARNRLTALTSAAAAVAPANVAEPALAPTPAPKPPVAAAPKPSTKKKGSPLPMLVGVLAVLGAGGWFGYQALMSDDTPADDTDIVAEPETPTVMASCESCPDMVVIPAGSFMMGSPAEEAGRSGNEGPMREVTLASFAMSKTEVTQAQWDACVEAGACRDSLSSGEADMPVSGVSFADAQAYTRWLSSVTGQAHRLPSEAEWEYAARGGTSTAYWWGGQFSGGAAVTGAAKAVTALPENPFGLVGILGNVREWTADCYNNSYADAPSDGRPVTSGNCDRRVVRGGSWQNGAVEHRAANRARIGRNTRDRSLGFRVVADLPSE